MEVNYLANDTSGTTDLRQRSDKESYLLLRNSFLHLPSSRSRCHEYFLLSHPRSFGSW